jgi:hypothetical protein
MSSIMIVLGISHLEVASLNMQVNMSLSFHKMIIVWCYPTLRVLDLMKERVISIFFGIHDMLSMLCTKEHKKCYHNTFLGQEEDLFFLLL